MNTKKTIQFLSIVCFSFSLISCDKEFNTIGANLIGDNHFAFGEPDRNATVLAFNENLGEVQSNNLIVNSLGIYRSAIFGKQTAHFVTQLSLPQTPPTFVASNEPVIEEVTLYIPYFSRLIAVEDLNATYELDSIYGNSRLKLGVYENGFLLRDFDPASNFGSAQKYYTDQFSDFDNNKRGASSNGTSVINGERLNNGVDIDNNEQFIFSSNQITETVVDAEGVEAVNRLAPGIFLKLNKDFFQKKIIDGAIEGKLANNNVFREYFRGLFFKVEQSAGEPNGSSLAMINFGAGKITIKYKEFGTVVVGEEPVRVDKTLELSLTGNTVSLVNQERSPEYTAALANTSSTEGDELLYLKGGPGSMTVIDLFGRNANGESAELEEYRSKNWLINEANLTFYIEKNKMADEVEPNRIYIYDLTNNRPVFDYFFDQTTNQTRPKFGKRIHSGIIVNEDDKGKLYKIRLTNHITQLLKNADSTNVRLGLVVTESIGITNNYTLRNETASGTNRVPVASVLNPLGTVLYGSKSSVPLDKRLKLEIYYTKPD